MATHTPGPWDLAPRDNLKAKMFIQGGEYIICEITGDPGHEANARLILAAPDLLAVCQSIESELIFNVTPIASTLDRLRAAIAKATAMST